MSCEICEKEDLENPQTFAGNTVCKECYEMVADDSDNSEPDTDDSEVSITGANHPEPNILADAVEFFHNRNTGITKRHFLDRFPEEQFNKYKLGWAPADDGLYEYLSDECGYTDEEILTTGLYTQLEDGNLSCLFQGRYIYPYFNQDMEPVYMIARTTGEKGGGGAGYDGHQKDFLAGKYAKISHTKPFCPYEEPIWGLNTLSEDTDRVIIAEGIADAIQTDAYGFNVISPVTTQFKTKHIEEVAKIVDEFGIEEVYIIPDSEDPSEDMVNKYGEKAVGEGLTGAIIMSDKLREHILADVYITELPRPDDTRKLDLDEFLKKNSASDLEDIIKYTEYTKEPEKYEFYHAYQEQKRPDTDFDMDEMSSTEKEFYSVDLLDVTPPQISSGFRGANPITHRGNSKNYFIVTSTGGESIAYDHKSKQTYNALTFILHKLGLREEHSIEGRLTPKETYKAFEYMIDEGIISEDAEIPSKAVTHIANREFEYSTDDLPPDVYYATLHYIQNETPYTLPEDKTTEYHSDDYFTNLPPFATNPNIIFATIKQSDDYSLPNSFDEIEYIELDDDGETVVWTLPHIDGRFDGTVLFAISMGLIDSEDLDIYALHRLTDAEYYKVCKQLLEECSYLTMPYFPMKLQRFLAQKYAVTLGEYTTISKDNRGYIREQFKNELDT